MMEINMSSHFIFSRKWSLEWFLNWCLNLSSWAPPLAITSLNSKKFLNFTLFRFESQIWALEHHHYDHQFINRPEIRFNLFQEKSIVLIRGEFMKRSSSSVAILLCPKNACVRFWHFSNSWWRRSSIWLFLASMKTK